jgi:hypothetical protein
MTMGAQTEAYLTFGGLSAYVTAKTAEGIPIYTQLTIQVLY